MIKALTWSREEFLLKVSDLSSSHSVGEVGQSPGGVRKATLGCGTRNYPIPGIGCLYISDARERETSGVKRFNAE